MNLEFRKKRKENKSDLRSGEVVSKFKILNLFQVSRAHRGAKFRSTVASKFKNKNSKRGFTLIEMIVSVGLFTIIMTISLGGLFMVINANRQAKSIKLVVNNLNLAIEGISRELRVGTDYCDQANGANCDTGSSGATQIWFTTDVGQDAYFRLNGNAIERSIDGSPALRMTGSDVQVEDMRFFIRGTQGGDSVQPSVMIKINGSINVEGELNQFSVQTMVSQRKLAP